MEGTTRYSLRLKQKVNYANLHRRGLNENNRPSRKSSGETQCPLLNSTSRQKRSLEPNPILETPLKRLSVDIPRLNRIIFHAVRRRILSPENPTKKYRWVGEEDVSSTTNGKHHEQKPSVGDLVKYRNQGREEKCFLMKEQIEWRTPWLIDQRGPLVAPGYKSLEKFFRSILRECKPDLDCKTIPSTPEEPDTEIHRKTYPTRIPLEDEYKESGPRKYSA